MKSLEFWKYLKCMTLICVFLQIGGLIGAVCTQLLDSIIESNNAIIASVLFIVTALSPFSLWYYRHTNDDHPLLRAILLVLFSAILGIAIMFLLLYFILEGIVYVIMEGSFSTVVVTIAGMSFIASPFILLISLLYTSSTVEGTMGSRMCLTFWILLAVSLFFLPLARLLL
ncbi:MAG: hypothetical protein J5767_01140 [Paludibacteraceae bacterium]|nr:hypothetical protein [Paludibacteraceae bacterium]